ncbi:MAG: ATP-binding protein [Firmicutes bacterium]|nr:ATP-binding protein [Bacillota bacterium]
MYIKRHMEAVLIDLLSQYPCVLISGPRQVGKSTMTEHLPDADKRKYITLDDDELKELALTDPKLFMQLHPPPICIDEIQKAPNLFSFIKLHIDKTHKAGDFILTGSQIYKLIKGIDETMTGRIALLDMQGISLSETTGLANVPFLPSMEIYRDRKPAAPFDAKAIFDRIQKGSMPSILTGQYRDSARYYSAYLSTYLQKDINDLVPGIDTLKFRRFITACACRTGQLKNINAIAEDAEISAVTANNWLNVLETIGVIFYLHPYSNNLLKRTIKTPKLYFYDTGLVCYLCKWQSGEAASVGAQAGALLETFAVSEIIKTYYNAGIEPYLYYYRDVDAKEIDLIIEHDQKLYPIEIKKAAVVDKRIASTFKIIEKSGLTQGTGAVLNLSDTLGALNADTLTIPISLI